MQKHKIYLKWRSSKFPEASGSWQWPPFRPSNMVGPLRCSQLPLLTPQGLAFCFWKWSLFDWPKSPGIHHAPTFQVSSSWSSSGSICHIRTLFKSSSDFFSPRLFFVSNNFQLKPSCALVIFTTNSMAFFFFFSSSPCLDFTFSGSLGFTLAWKITKSEALDNK